MLSGQTSPQLSGLYTGPYFSLYTAGNVSARVGEVAHLPCRVHQVNNHTVSWIRNRDSAILSIDGETIIHDRRMAVIKTINRGDYVLSIRLYLEIDLILLSEIQLTSQVLFVWQRLLLISDVDIISLNEIFYLQSNIEILPVGLSFVD